jgi:Ankyrin repeats (3 copies)/MATH domain
MRWRSAAEEVVTSTSASSSTSTNSSSATCNNSRRSLNEQAEDTSGSHSNPSQLPIDEYNYDSKSTQQHHDDDAHYDGGDDAPDDTYANSRGQKRSLQMDKNVGNDLSGGGLDPPEDCADTTTSADLDSTTKAQQNTRKNPTSSSMSNGTTIGHRKSDEELDDDAEEGDDAGTDHAEETFTPNIVWMPQNVQSTCEFTHTILDYAQKRESGCKKAEYSAITQDELGNRWRLIVYVNGNGRASNHHLSLFLQVADADDLPFGWKKAVSYVLTLEHPTNAANLSYAKRNPDKTFKLCPKAIDWGWSQFITSDRIQQEGFVKLDTLTVRAQVTVKSSSVVIDEEDSELYLKCAVEEGDAKSVKLCLDQGASVNCQFKDDLYTPLHTACSSGTNSGSMDVLNLLLASGADCNSCNKWKETPLLIAANNGHKTAVEALLEHGADPSLCSEAGWSALTFAAHKVRYCSCDLHSHYFYAC